MMLRTLLKRTRYDMVFFLRERERERQQARGRWPRSSGRTEVAVYGR